MDKFGIFNLLNSFFNAKTQSETDSKTNGAPFADVLGSLFGKKDSTENTPTQTPNQQTQAPKNTAPKKQKPLQYAMISAMTSHDDFIKRVKNNGKK